MRSQMKRALRIKRLIVSLLMGRGRRIGGAIKIRGVRGFPILTYHKIVPLEEVRDGIDSMLCVEPKRFASHVGFLKRHFRMLSLKQVFKDPEGVFSSADGKPGCVLTFDDGSADFYDYAYKVLSEHQVPATLFIPTGYIGTDRELWTIRLQRLLAKILEKGVPDQNTPKPIHPLAACLEIEDGPLKKRIGLLADAIKRLSIKETEQILSSLSIRWDIPERRIPERAFLSWEEVREIADSGLVDIGSHTQDHLILSKVSKAEIEHQLNRSKRILIREGLCRGTFIPFAYPNGEHDRRVRRMVKEAGYGAATTTRLGWNVRGYDPYCLKRIGVYQTFSESDILFGCRILGLL